MNAARVKDEVGSAATNEEEEEEAPSDEDVEATFEDFSPTMDSIEDNAAEYDLNEYLDNPVDRNGYYTIQSDSMSSSEDSEMHECPIEWGVNEEVFDDTNSQELRHTTTTITSLVIGSQIPRLEAQTLNLRRC